jgi:hypothetical protein
MKNYFRSIVRESLHRLVGNHRLEEWKHLADTFNPLTLRKLYNEVTAVNQGVQKLLDHSYRRLAQNRSFPNLCDVGLRCFSQNEEDGLLLYLFSLVGTTNKAVVEICAGDGIECNAANLIINQGWRGLLVDGDERNAERGRRFYARCRDTFFYQPAFVQAWITAENVNEIVLENGFVGDIDLLSLDLDGVDYWVWKALTCIRPRVVLLEFNPRWGPHRAVTVPYKPDFQADLDLNRAPWCFGASLAAFAKLGRERGYRLAGTNRHGSNALFLRGDVGAGLFPELSPQECFEQSPYLNYWTPDWLPSRDERPEWWDVVEV